MSVSPLRREASARHPEYQYLDLLGTVLSTGGSSSRMLTVAEDRVGLNV